MKSLLLVALILSSTASFAAPVEKHDVDCEAIVSGNLDGGAMAGIVEEKGKTGSKTLKK